VRLVLASFGAEWLKTRKRPAVWVLGGVLVGLALLISLILLAALASLSRNPAGAPGVNAEALKQTLYPAHFVQAALNNFSGNGLDGAIALIVGVLTYGSEYGWGTVKTVFTQRPGRLATLAGKVAALAVVLAVYVALVFAASAASAAGMAGYFGAASSWPALLGVARGMLAGWLIMGMWAALGMLLSVLFRQSALAIGLGLLYAVVLENLLFALLSQFSWVQTLQRGFPGANATALVRSFGIVARTTNTPPPVADATQAALVLAGYLLVFVALTGALLRLRDVT
jgi:ABC-type transport system involved in multi-copper enzyme maturation permease subunit